MDERPVVIELGEVHEIPRHAHQGVEVFFLLKGSVEFDLDGSLYRMLPGDIILCNSGEAHGAKRIEPNIMFRLLVTEDFLDKETGGAQVHMECNSCLRHSQEKAPEYDQLRRNMTRLMLSYYQDGKRKKLEFKSILLRVLFLLSEYFQAEKEIKFSAGSDERIQSVLKHIHKFYRNDITLQSIAAGQHISTHYLSRLFKRNLGMGFIAYLNQTRLASAVNDLLHSKESVIKIALNNGFPNVGSFNRLFRKVYKDTPAKYRALRYIGQERLSHESEMTEAFKESGELVKYLRLFDAKHAAESGGKKTLRIGADAETIRLFRSPGKIITIGSIHELLKSEIREQIDSLCGRTGIDYVHFACLYNDGMYRYKSAVYARYEYFQALDYLRASSLKPFIQFDIQDILEDPEPDTPPLEAVRQRITLFLRAALERYGADFLRRWRFEIAYPDNIDSDILWRCYCAIYQAIKAAVPEAGIGLLFRDCKNRLDEDVAILISFLRKCELNETEPSFLTYYVYPAEYKESMESADYYQYRNYNTLRARRLAMHLRACGMERLELVLMQWNTLSGFTTAESNAFYRSALLLDEIVSISQWVTGVAYWLNTYICEAATDMDYFDVLAIFLFAGLKRPVYFALTFLDDLYDEVIYQTDSTLVTRDSHGDLAILVMNPCYFDPVQAADKFFTDTLRMFLTLDIEGLYGRQIIERYHMDNSRTALYDRWAAMGFPSMLDNAVIEHLNKTVNIDYTIFEEDMTGGHKLNITLDYNEAELVRIKKLS